jgi:hypothetical protein
MNGLLLSFKKENFWKNGSKKDTKLTHIHKDLPPIHLKQAKDKSTTSSTGEYRPVTEKVSARPCIAKVPSVPSPGQQDGASKTSSAVLFDKTFAVRVNTEQSRLYDQLKPYQTIGYNHKCPYSRYGCLDDFVSQRAEF